MNLNVIKNAVDKTRQAAVEFLLNILKEFQKPNLGQNKKERGLKY